MANAAEIIFDICVNYPQCVSGICHFKYSVHRLICTSLRTKSIRAWLKIRFEYRLKNHLRCHLHNSVLDCRYPQCPLTSVCFWNIGSSNRLTPIFTSFQFLCYLIQHLFFAVLLHIGYADFINAACSTIGFYPLPRFFQDIFAVYLVIYCMESSFLVCFGCKV